MHVREILNDYKPIDYNAWDYSGKGANIATELSPLEGAMWIEALPVQDKRHDPGHAEHVVYFALKLLQYHPSANRNIVMPAAILHDTGWGLMPDEERALFSTPARKVYGPFLRQRHQELGKEFADKVLTEIGYGDSYDSYMNWQKSKEHILEIISQHDTRQGFYSLDDYAVNDGIMRDADKLWRPTLTAMVIESPRSNRTVEQIWDAEQKAFAKTNFLYSPISKEIARIEFEHTMKVYRENPEIIEKIRRAIK
jgi:hypothetical protein